MRKVFFVFFMISALVFGIAMPASLQQKANLNQYGGIYKFALPVGPATPIGLASESAPDSWFASRPALETLMRVKSGGTIEPLLATEWKVAKDGKSIAISLRKGVKFHDGSDFNAKAVKWNMDRMIESKKVPDWQSVDIVNDYTVRLNIKAYKNIILTQLATGASQMSSPTAVEKNGIDWARWHPIGTGPFIFVDYQRDFKVTYKKNPNYWMKGRPYLDGIEYVVIADETVRKLAFQKGDIHMMQPRSKLVVQELVQLGFPHFDQPGGTYLLIPDSNNPKSPFADKRVRLAVSHAIDRVSFAKALGYGGAVPAYQLFPGIKEANVKNLKKHEYNPALAKKLLAEAGYPDGFDTTIYTFVRMVNRDYINVIVNMLKQVGIRVKAEFPEAGKYEEYRFKGWTNAMLGHGFAVFENINSSFNLYFGGPQFPSMKKPAGWKNSFEAALNSINVDPAKEQALIKVIHDDVMVIPYLEETATTIYQKGFHRPGIDQYWVTTFAEDQVWLEPKLR
jgi:peptide/nickel transport system substrate-binding protein